MARRRRITSTTNTIIFNEDAVATSASVGYSCTKNTPLDVGRPQSGREIGMLRNIPTPAVRSYIQKRGFSVVKIPLTLIHTTHALLEDLIHDLTETLEDAALYIHSRRGRGAKAVFEYKTDGAVAISYKTVFYGWIDEKGRRGFQDGVDCFQLEGMVLYLVCEPAWHPSSSTQLADATVIYNHNDVGLGGAHAAHLNYIQIPAANILGDLEGRTRLLVEFDAKTVADNTKLLRVVRRTRGTPANLAYWLEGENMVVPDNWAAGGDNACSNVSRVSDAAAASGSIVATVAAPGNDDYGRFASYGRLWADDIVNTKFRISSYFAASGWMYNKWYWLTAAEKWQLLYLGDIFWDPSLRTGVDINTLVLKLEYVKDAAGDIARCDYIWLAPTDESVLEVALPNYDVTVALGQFFVSSDIDDFEYTAIENAVPDLLIPGVRHGRLKLMPGVINRLYFYMDSYDGTDNICEVDNATPNAPLTMKVTLDHMPQYVSPLE